jgi:hypothetical protein
MRVPIRREPSAQVVARNKEIPAVYNHSVIMRRRSTVIIEFIIAHSGPILHSSAVLCHFTIRCVTVKVSAQN